MIQDSSFLSLAELFEKLRELFRRLLFGRGKNEFDIFNEI